MDDIALGSTYYTDFCAFRVDTGAPADVASIAVSAYPDNSATQLTAGITVSQPDSITGSYNIAVAATVANGYTFGTTYALKITTGTVNSVSVVGAVVGQFKIRKGTPGLLRTGLCQASTSTTCVLDSGTSYADDFLIGATIVLVSGTGAGQSRVITDWVSATDTATVDTWQTTPDTTTIFELYAGAPASLTSLPSVNVAQIEGGDPTDTLVTAATAATPTISTLGNNTITAASIAANAITAAKIATAALPSAKFDEADPVPVNVVEVNDVVVTGDGQPGTEWGP